jgi:hypothetical protein
VVEWNRPESEHREVRFVTKDGATVTGRLLNQDAISVQLITPKEELKSYLRSNIRDFSILDKGLMPSSQGKLTDQQIPDVVAYLSSLNEHPGAFLAPTKQPDLEPTNPKSSAASDLARARQAGRPAASTIPRSSAGSSKSGGTAWMMNFDRADPRSAKALTTSSSLTSTLPMGWLAG